MMCKLFIIIMSLYTGDPLALLSLAHCYTHGKGVEKSFEKAFEHHLEASKSGIMNTEGFCIYSYACNMTLHLHIFGHISGNPVALYNVGGHYFAGKGVEHSFEKAAENYEKAAVLGFPPAQVNLGNMHYNGLGVSKSKDKAKELYKLAAEKDKNAQILLKEIEEEEQKALEEDTREKEREEETNKNEDGTGRT